MEHRKPTAISRKLDTVKEELIGAYDTLMNQLSADEVVTSWMRIQPTRFVRFGCWAPKQVPVAVEQSSGREPPEHPRRGGS